MTELDSRLARCLEAVFPSLEPLQTATASVNTIADWDSVHALTLLEVLNEEFGLSIPDEDAEDLTSFGAIRAYLEAHAR